MLTTVGQFFVRTKLFGLTTTVFVRRMIVLYVPLALVATHRARWC